MPSPNMITPNELSELIGAPDAPRILDVRIDEDVAADPRRLPGAMPAGFRDIASAVGNAGQAVVICHHGLKLSQGAAAILRNEGVAATFLTGGHVGWAEAGLPTVTCAAPNLWVMPERPALSLVAAAWLLRRFLAPRAKFLFVEADQTALVADRFDAALADEATFGALLDDTGLRTPGLQALRDILGGSRAESAGLSAIHRGLLLRLSDDAALLDAAFPVLDALHAEARA